MPNRRKIIAIIGDANSNEENSDLAFLLGKLIIDNGFRLANGALYGVMEHSAKGARNSSSYKDGDILGVLPSYNPNECNQYIDIPIATGIGVARNAVLMSMCDAVIAIGESRRPRSGKSTRIIQPVHSAHGLLAQRFHSGWKLVGQVAAGGRPLDRHRRRAGFVSRDALVSVLLRPGLLDKRTSFLCLLQLLGYQRR